MSDDMDDMCPNCVTPWKCNGPHVSDAHTHEWVRRQNVTTKGYAMPPYDACECGAARPVSLHHCPSCTCVIPSGVAQ